jgi:FAD/FMN-containing dehydrogenase
MTMSAAGPVPRAAHDAAVAELARRRRELRPGEPARLGKPSSNLFRFGVPPAQRLDASALTGVLDVDPGAGTAVVQGMTTYEDLVAATLARGVMPLVVPQLRTITLGGAVTGLGIESSSFRHGLPHESVREMDVLLADGELITVTPDGEHGDLYAGFANSYATLGYAVRLEIDVRSVAPYVALEHVRVGPGELPAAVREACGRADVDFVDGVVFGRDEQYLTLGPLHRRPRRRPERLHRAAGLLPLGARAAHRRPHRARLPVALGHRLVLVLRGAGRPAPAGAARVAGALPAQRRLPRIVALDRRTRFSSRVRSLLRQPQEEPVIQDVEIPVDRLPEFLDGFHRDIGITPVWLCPVQLRPAPGGGTRTWPLYPMEPGELYVNVGFWSGVPQRTGDPEWHNRRIEA